MFIFRFLLVLFFVVIFSCRKTISCASDLKRYLFTLYDIISLPISVLSRLRYVSWSSPPPSLFNWPRAQLYVKIPIICTFWSDIYCLIYFVFIECLYVHLFWHLGKVSKKVTTERDSSWIDAYFSCLGFTSFNVPPCLLPKATNKIIVVEFVPFYVWYWKSVCS